VIDKVEGRFLDFVHFVVRRRAVASCVRAFSSLLVAILLASFGCSPQPNVSGAVEDSLTSGRISVVCAAEAMPLVVRERDAFRALYPRATIEIRAGSSREAIAALFAAKADLAVITRELEVEERRAATQGMLEVEGFRFARGALVMVVHSSNPVENMAIDEIRRIYKGDATRWSEFSGAERPIVPVVQPIDSDITDEFTQRVMGEESMGARSVYEDSDSAVVARVRSDPSAIGYVSLDAVAEGVRPLRVASLTGLPYWKPDLEAVYQQDYPLTRNLSLYVRTDGSLLAKGFITFVTGRDGQKIVRDQGLVPTTVPVRFVRRSPMLGSH
jgi:phosphate transport system substrate-binding protein